MPSFSLQACHQSRQRSGLFDARKKAVPPVPAVRQGELRFTTATQVALFLLLIRNAEAGPTPARSPTTAPVPASAHGCPPAEPASFASGLHTVGAFLKAPVKQTYKALEGVYVEAVQHRCPPTEDGPLTDTLLDAADLGLNVAEADLDPDAPALLHGAGDLLEIIGDELEGKPLSDEVEDLLGFLPGFKPKGHPSVGSHPVRPGITHAVSSIPVFDSTAQIIQQREALDPGRMLEHAPEPNGIVRYRDARTGEPGRAVQVRGNYYCVQHASENRLVVAGVTLAREGSHYVVADAPAEAEVRAPRCRRTPGGACAVLLPEYSPALSDLLRGHLDRGIDATTAQHRGIVPNPHHPGWFERIKDGQHKSYLRFEGHNFRVRPHQYGNCQRLTVHLRNERPGAGGGPALVDIVERATAEGSTIITQTEFNTRRGMKEGASGPYEHALKHAPRVRLSQFQRAALLRYQGAGEAALDRFMLDGEDLAYRRREFEGEIHSLRAAMARIPAYTGRVFRGAMLPTEVLERLRVDDTLYIHTFVRANGDRGTALEQMRGRDVPAGQQPMLLNIVARHAHPTGLYTLSDEGEVLLRNGLKYRVAAIQPGELILEEVGVARHAPAAGSAVTVRLG